jgi:hypothetical protein
MALEAARKIGMDGSALIGSASSAISQFHNNLKVSADTSTDPIAISQAGAFWVTRPPRATNLYLRAAWTATETLGGSPAVAVWGVDRVDADGNPEADANTQQLLAATALSPTKVGTDTYDYGAFSSAIDCRGMAAIIVQVTTAGTTATAAVVQGQWLN